MQENEQESMRNFIFEVIKMFVLALVIIVPVRTFLFQPFIVRGDSMVPSFHEREYLIVNEFGYKNIELFNSMLHIKPRKDLAYGDVVVFRAPVKQKDFYIKRVIGVGGDTIKIDNGKVMRYNDAHPDGEVLDESAYLAPNQLTNGTVDVTLEENEYFVLGDNRAASSDSRTFGPIRKNDVIGKVLLRAYPLTEFSIL